MPKISDYPKLWFTFIGNFMEIHDGEYGKVIGYIHLKEMDEMYLLSMIDEMIGVVREKIRDRDFVETSRNVWSKK